MSNTSGPTVPEITGRLADRFVPSNETVTDRLAVALIDVSFLLNRRGGLELRGKIMAARAATQPSQPQHVIGTERCRTPADAARTPD